RGWQPQQAKPQTQPVRYRKHSYQNEPQGQLRQQRLQQNQQGLQSRQRKISAGNYGLGRTDSQEFSVQSDGLGPRTFSMGSRQHSGLQLSRIKQAVASAAQHYGHCRRGLRPVSYQQKSLDLWGSMDIDDDQVASGGGDGASAAITGTAPVTSQASKPIDSAADFR
uniref:Pecanex-like protein n=1 Tax=Macrostomum lignano TaxID=282301 RepID=A0A1I8GIY1_9PLAT